MAITKELSAGVLEFVLSAINSELPKEPNPRQLAEELIAMADRVHVPIEDLIYAAFPRWAQGETHE